MDEKNYKSRRDIRDTRLRRGWERTRRLRAREREGERESQTESFHPRLLFWYPELVPLYSLTNSTLRFRSIHL